MNDRVEKSRERILRTRERTTRARKVLRKHGIPFQELVLDQALDVHSRITFRPYSGKWVNRVTGVTGEGLSTLLIELGAGK